jgi:hypothetical protein
MVVRLASQILRSDHSGRRDDAGTAQGTTFAMSLLSSLDHVKRVFVARYGPA